MSYYYKLRRLCKVRQTRTEAKKGLEQLNIYRINARVHEMSNSYKMIQLLALHNRKVLPDRNQSLVIQINERTQP